MAADARVPSAAADTETIGVGSASSSTDGGVGLSGGALGQSLSPVTEQTPVGPGCSRTFSDRSPGRACALLLAFTFALLVLLAFVAVGIPCFVYWLFSGYF